MRILFIDQDISASSDLRSALKAVKGTVDQPSTGEEAIELVGYHDYDAVVLEVALPDINGLEVIRRMRADKVITPILVVAANARNEVKVQAFGLGADDFLPKPCDPDELMARLRAIIRRSRRSTKAKLQVGPLELDVTAHQAWANGERLQLTGKEFAILELLVLRKGSTLSKEAIIEHLYSGIDVPEIKIIDVFVCKLRKKLAELGAGDMIGTVWGRGYVLHQPEAAANWKTGAVFAPAKAA